MGSNNILNNFSNSEKNISPLRILAAISIIAGTWSMLFEIYFFKSFQLELYLARVSVTFLSLIIFVLTFKKFSRRIVNILTHVLILGMIFSFIFTIYMIPTTIYINSQILSLLIFTFAIVFSWEVTQQIIVAIYYNLLFAASIFYSEDNIYQLPNILSLVIFVSFISLLSVAASAVIYRNRKRYLEKSKEINFLFNNAPVGIVRINSAGDILTANKYFINLFGLNESQTEENLFVLLAPGERERELISSKIISGKYEHIEESIYDKNNNELYLQITSEKLKTDSDNEIAIECLISDKTKEKLSIGSFI